MKTKKWYTVLMILVTGFVLGQDRTTVSATNSEISDNLDLRAIASIFGDSKDLEDFEYRINDPKQPISNLDLNQDNQVDYLRVIESVEGRTHIIVIQSVLGKDLFQDVATIEVEKDRNNRVYVQVVGDVYMYGRNYIYEPVYVHTPVIYNHFWVHNYRPYYSAWYWGYYPSYYYVWTPFPLFRYRHHIGLCINFNHHYNYVRNRRCESIYYSHYYGRRANGYERNYPNRSFESRNSGYANRYELDQTRNRTRDVAYNNQSNGFNTPRPTTNNSTRDESVRNNTYNTPRPASNNGTRDESVRSNTYNTPRPAINNNTRDESVRNTTTTPRSNNSSTPRNQSIINSDSPRASTPRSSSFENTRGSEVRNSSAPRIDNSSQRGFSSRSSNTGRNESVLNSRIGGGGRR